MIFDSHAHYDDEAFDDDRETVLDEVKKSGISYIIDAGSGMESSKKAVELAKGHDFMYAAVGIHPENAGEYDEYAKESLIRLSKEKKVVAIGEIGLDYYYEDGAAKELQMYVFEEQVKLALKLGLPIIVHDREAHGDTFDIIRKYAHEGLRGVIHCYSGSTELAREYVKLGFYIGFTGVITFKNSRKAVEVLEAIPHDRILIETDCPYLAPVPLRGKRNDSRNLKYVIEKACEVLGIDEQCFSQLTVQNGKKLFNIL